MTVCKCIAVGPNELRKFLPFLLGEQRAWQRDTLRYQRIFFDEMSTRMDQPLVIRRRNELHFVLLSILTLVISLSTLARCASVDTLQDISHNKPKFPIINYIDNNIHRLITKDTYLYKNPTGLFDGTSKKNIGQIPSLHNVHLKSDLKWNSIVSSGLDTLKFLLSMNKICGNAHNVLKCAGDVILRSVSTILQPADSYENNEDDQNSGTRNDKIHTHLTERNVTLFLKKFMKHLRNYILWVNVDELGNEAKYSARSG